MRYIMFDIGNKVIEQPTKKEKSYLSTLGLHHGHAALSGVRAQYRSYLVACVGVGVRRRRHCRRRCRRREAVATELGLGDGETTVHVRRF